MKFIPALGAAATLTLVLSAGQAMSADMAAGEKLYKKCKVCHTLEEGGKNKVGPNLYGIFGRKAATVEGFKYSKAMKASDVTWDDESMDKFLKKPKKFIPKTKMAFPGLKKEKDRENIIAYLREKTGAKE